ncbi:MAG: TonB-dependent receptor plug domain-containing protein [Psychrobium sp.]|nr:TonB-dependent receptor plug domain-containing protein [Psychrobium sp.]
MTHKISKICLAVTASLFIFMPLSSSFAAQETEKNISSAQAQNNSDYPADFFDQYQPQNAYDMIERLPGFSFDRGNNARGFGGNAGNVLIDGARPTSKSGGLEGALKRIPADQVERILIIRGGVGAGIAAGQSVVANIIRRKNMTSGTWALKFRRSADGRVLPNLEAAISTVIGGWDSSFDIDIGAAPGSRTAFIERRDANGVLTKGSFESSENRGFFAFSNGQIAKDFNNGKLTLNGRIGHNTWADETQRNTYNNRLPDNSAPDGAWSNDVENVFETVEIGIDWVAQFDDWKWHSLALMQIEDEAFISDLKESENNVASGDSVYVQDGLKKEFIVRNTFGYTGTSAFKPEYGIEIANNSLATKREYSKDGSVVSLDNANITVEELRAELFASFVYSYSAALSIEGGLTAEFSQIKVSGVNSNKQSLSFLKPRLSANYKLTPSLNLTVDAQHVVGQLNFNDFAASVSAEDDRSVSGNSDLVPYKSNELIAGLDWSFSEKGSIKFSAFHYWRDDILEEIILPSGGQGTGNAGKAKVWGFDTKINIPVDAILDNALLEINYEYIGSSFDDVIIGRSRHISGYEPSSLVVKLRQDVTAYKFSWGIQYYGDFTNDRYLVNEIGRYEGNKRSMAFIETSYFSGYKIQLEMSNATVSKYTRSRQFFNETRNGAYLGTEVSARRHEPEYKLSIWGSF